MIKISKNTFIIIGLSILIVGLTILYYVSYHPSTLVEGNNRYDIGKYNLETKGLIGIKTLISKSNLNDKYMINYLNIGIDNQTNIEYFVVTLSVFDNDDNYIGQINFSYKNKVLTYNSLTNDNSSIVIKYNPNAQLDFLNDQFNKIPLREQIEISDFSHYVITYDVNTIISKDIAIFDGRNNQKIKSLVKEDYDNKLGGSSDGTEQIIFRLYDGTSIITENQYLYVFDPKVNSAVINQNFMMDNDYYMDETVLKFTRDYGHTWINTDLTNDEIEETINFYRDGYQLLPNSWFLSSDSQLPITYFYGKEPYLKISNDNGFSWTTNNFEDKQNEDKPFTKRVVGFASKTFGYIALGTDYSNGTGEVKKGYFTYDGGKSFQAITLPCDNTSNTLIDMVMYDEQIGVIMLDNPENINFPLVYITQDGSNTWRQVVNPYLTIPSSITYLTDIDQILYQNNYYYITIGQGLTNTQKTVFKTNDLGSNWEFVKMFNDSIHTTG